MANFNTLNTMPPSLAVPKFIKNTAKGIQFISNHLAMLFSGKLFMTPVNFQVPEREKFMWKSAQKKRVKINALNKEIDVLTYGYSPKKVLLVHGWCGRSTQLFMIADKLLEKGFMVVSFDGPAHGKSEGKQTNMLEFIAAIKQLSEEFGPFESAVGHSFGGMTLYNVANEIGLKNFVSIGAGDKVSTIINNFTTNIGLQPKIGKKLYHHFNRKMKLTADDYASSVKAKGIQTPVLVVHDANDGDVAVSCAINIRQNLQKGSLLITNGLGHTKILRDKTTMNTVANFIINNL